MPNIRQHLANLSNASVRDLDYERLSSVFGDAVQERNAEDLENEVERELSASLHDRHIDWMKEAVAQAIEAESAEINGTLPVISIFEATQVAKAASKEHSRDIGVLNLATHMERKWKSAKDAHLTASDVLFLKNHYSSNYPKSAAKEVIESFTRAGYLDLPVGKLMDIASQIRTQDDFDYYIKEAGLHTNNPYSKKARQFILALLNGEESPDPFELTAQSGILGPKEEFSGYFEEDFETFEMFLETLSSAYPLVEWVETSPSEKDIQAVSSILADLGYLPLGRKIEEVVPKDPDWVYGDVYDSPEMEVLMDVGAEAVVMAEGIKEAYEDVFGRRGAAIKRSQHRPYYPDEDSFFLDSAGGDPEEAEKLKSIARDYIQRAESAIEEGWAVDINTSIPYISVENPNDPDGGYYFEDYEADELLKEVPEWIDPEDYILAQLMNW